MNVDRRERLKALFHEARQLTTPERRSFLETQCGDDHELVREVESLLSQQSTQFMGEPSHLQRVRTDPKNFESPQIDNYQVLSVLGEGGMGVVYLAEQERPVQRMVALKLIKRGLGTDEVLARFEAERQALAIMNHPNVATVFDAGVTEHGRPYFVMEFVKGVPITEHCDRQRLTTRERLELFTQVCEGVQHAHQKAIIHRDLKPSNVLVTIQDERVVPKIIDFGVAKAIGHRLTERTLFTGFGQIVGTPEYMSPEQAEMTQQDVDTRADVYSLGVMLYELLVGALPFDPKELRRAEFGEIPRKIREEEPSKPSTRVTTLDESSEKSARQRRTDPANLARQLRGDLDWVTMKALEKDRTRRYETVSQLAADVERHLRNQPVLASPASAAYRVGKFVTRNRTVVLAGALVALSLVVAVVLSSIGLVRARRAEKVARSAEAIASEGVETAQELSEFMVFVARGEDRRAETLLQRCIAERDVVRAASCRTGLGWLRLRNKKFAEAEQLFVQAIETWEQRSYEQAPHMADAYSLLGGIRVQQGNLEDGRRLYQRSFEIRERTLYSDHPVLTLSLLDLARVSLQMGDVEAARGHYRRAMSIDRSLYGEDDPLVVQNMRSHAQFLRQHGYEVEAEELDREAQALEGKSRLLQQ